MSFSTEWDDVYKNNQQLSIWPFSDLVSLVMRHGKSFLKGSRVLELGVGAGANIPFFLNHECEYYGIEGSPTIVQQLQKKFPQIAQNLVAQDFTQSLVFSGQFDFIIDRSSLTHNSTSAITHCLELCRKQLKPHGLYIGIDWFSTQHDDFLRGKECGEYHTRDQFPSGQFEHVGRVHFFDEQHLNALVSQSFDLIYTEHKVHEQQLGGHRHRFASWNFVAKPLSPV